MSSDTEKVTDTTRVYLRLRRDILKGLLKPDEKLRIKSISSQYHCGVSPVREALNRLSSEGVVDHRERRGFFVPSVSIDGLEALVKTRCWLEGKALQESIANHSQEWEEHIVLTFHRLIRKTAILRETVGDYVGNQEWEELHRDFHLSLISGCGSTWLIKYCTDLIDHAYRYRSISDVLDYHARDVEAEHCGMKDAAIERDADLALSRLTEHYMLTLSIIRRNIDAISSPDL